MELGYKISEIDLKKIKQYLRIEPSFTEDDEMLTMIYHAAKEYIKSYSNMTDIEIDKYEPFTVACMMLIADFYEVRQVNINTGVKAGVNKMLAFILSMNRNLG